MSCALLRVQDAEGRGPYRPGFSHVWCDDDHAERNPTWMDEFGVDLMGRVFREEAAGCGFRTAQQATAWFSPREMKKLRELGYSFVTLPNCRVVAESPRQVVFARRQRLRSGVLLLPWPQAVAA